MLHAGMIPLRAARQLLRPPRTFHSLPTICKARRYCAVCDSKHSNQQLSEHTETSGTRKETTKAGSKPLKLKATKKEKVSTPAAPADHRQIAIEQELFTTSIYSPGSPLFLPDGARIFHRLVDFIRAQYVGFGFKEVITPTIYKKSLWEKSGHWENYREDMFSVSGRGSRNTTALSEEGGEQAAEDDEFGLKPMNCPGHCLLFAAKQRSFRELPIRYADFSPLHRNEISGALSGLTRVRRFHQDDGHIFCRPSQVSREILDTLRFVKLTYETFGLGPYRLTLSTRPNEGYIGELEDWQRAENALRDALDESGLPWTVNEGDGAFYGPKIDIILKDSDGKEHQSATIQLDFQLPKRFELEYMAPAPELEQKGETTTDPELLAKSGPVRPVMIHRAVLGSVERFMALLIEHYNGKWPFWLNPRQVMIVTVSDDPKIVERAYLIKDKLAGITNLLGDTIKKGHGAKVTQVEIPATLDRRGLQVDIDDSPRSVGKKVGEAKRKHYSMIVVIGEKDLSDPDWNMDVDLSAIPDPRGILGIELAKHTKREKSTLGTTESAEQTLGESEMAKRGHLDRAGEQSEEESFASWEGKTVDDIGLLTKAQTSRMRLNPWGLRDLATRLGRLYV